MTLDSCCRGVLKYNRWCSACMIFHSIYGQSCGGSQGLNDRHGLSNLRTVKTRMLEEKKQIFSKGTEESDTKRSPKKHQTMQKWVERGTEMGELASSSSRLYFEAAGMSLQKHPESSHCLHPETWSLPSVSHFQTHQTPLTVWPGFFWRCCREETVPNLSITTMSLPFSCCSPGSYSIATCTEKCKTLWSYAVHWAEPPALSTHQSVCWLTASSGL